MKKRNFLLQFFMLSPKHETEEEENNNVLRSNLEHFIKKERKSFVGEIKCEFFIAKKKYRKIFVHQ